MIFGFLTLTFVFCLRHYFYNFVLITFYIWFLVSVCVVTLNADIIKFYLNNLWVLLFIFALWSASKWRVNYICLYPNFALEVFFFLRCMLCDVGCILDFLKVLSWSVRIEPSCRTLPSLTEHYAVSADYDSFQKRLIFSRRSHEKHPKQKSHDRLDRRPSV